MTLARMPVKWPAAAMVCLVGNEDCDQGDANSEAPGAECRTDCTNQRCGDGYDRKSVMMAMTSHRCMHERLHEHHLRRWCDWTGEQCDGEGFAMRIVN